MARAVDPAAFGAFSAVAVTGFLCLGISHALTSEVFIVVFGSKSRAESGDGLRDAAGCALVFGAGLSVVAFSVSWMFDGALREPLRAFAFVLPGLFVQDVWRYAFFAQRRPGAAFANDLVWAIVQFLGFISVVTTGTAGIGGWILAWGGGAAAAALVGAMQSAALPRPSGFRRWLSEHRALGPRFAAEFGSVYGAFHAVLTLVGLTSGLAEIAKLRAADLLFGPLHAVVLSARLSITPAAVRAHARNPRSLAPFTVVVVVALGAVASAWSLVAALVPDALGVRLLGESWFGAREVLFPFAVGQILAITGFGVISTLRATRSAERTFQARLTIAVVGVLLGGVGSVLWAGYGAAVGIAAANALGVLLLVRHVMQVLGDESFQNQRRVVRETGV